MNTKCKYRIYWFLLGIKLFFVLLGSLKYTVARCAQGEGSTLVKFNLYNYISITESSLSLQDWKLLTIPTIVTIILFHYVDTWPSAHFKVLIMGDFTLLQTVFHTIIIIIVKVLMTKIFLRIKSFFIWPFPLLLGFLCYRLSNLFITDTKGTNLSVCISEIRIRIRLGVWSFWDHAGPSYSKGG